MSPRLRWGVAAGKPSVAGGARNPSIRSPRRHTHEPAPLPGSGPLLEAQAAGGKMAGGYLAYPAAPCARSAWPGGLSASGRAWLRRAAHIRPFDPGSGDLHLRSRRQGHVSTGSRAPLLNRGWSLRSSAQAGERWRAGAGGYPSLFWVHFFGGYWGRWW